MVTSRTKRSVFSLFSSVNDYAIYEETQQRSDAKKAKTSN